MSLGNARPLFRVGPSVNRKIRSQRIAPSFLPAVAGEIMDAALRAGTRAPHRGFFARAATFIVLLFGAAGHSAADAYVVEVLAFESRTPDSSGEYFPASPAAPVDWTPAAPSVVQYTGAGLSAVAATLAKHPAYRLLFSSSWQQPLAERSAAPAVPVVPPDPQRFVAELTGTLRLYEAPPLLFVEADLLFTPTAEPTSYRLREKRRVKLNELHYFDHPHFGALVRVSRVPQG
jgi:hypothetical protein